MLVTAVFVGGVVLSNWSRLGAITEHLPPDFEVREKQSPSHSPDFPSTRLKPDAGTQKFSHCGLVRTTCVVDGDTFWLHGVKVRMADIDTPEVSQPRCASEKALGERATSRLIVLLNDGPFDLAPIGEKDEDQYGRKLRVVMRDGQSLGDQLVAEGLARTWTGRRQPWC
jgi:endonuclease YncB( thermonuclease family)